MSKIKEDILKLYVYRINSIESTNKNDKKHNGYLINYTDYKELKNKIDYEKNKGKKAPYKFDITDKEKIMKIKDLEFKTKEYLINMLFNDNKYIIVSPELWKIICEQKLEKEKPIEYQYIESSTILNLNLNREIIKFTSQKDNIIEYSNLKNKTYNLFDSIKKTYQNISRYYTFENLVENGLKVKKEEKINGKGYLLEKEWIDKWKQQIKYDNIKRDYLNKGKNEKEVRDKLIYLFEEKKLKYNDLSEIKNNELNTKQKLEKYLETNSLVLVSTDFISSLCQTHKLKEFDFSLYENTININFSANDFLQIEAKDNIISTNINTKEANIKKGESTSSSNKTNNKPIEFQNIQTNELNLENTEEEKINKYLSYSVKLNIEYSKFKKLIEEQSHSIVNECYLISKTLIETLENLLCFKEIGELICSKEELVKNYKGENAQIENIKKEIKPEIITKLKELNSGSIEYDLKIKDFLSFNLSKTFMGNKSKNAFYYENCKLISKDIYNIIKDLIQKYIEKIKKVECIFDKGEIIILVKDGQDEAINIGNIDSNNELKIKKVIEYDSKNTPSDIFSKVKTSGYNYISNNNISTNKSSSQSSSNKKINNNNKDENKKAGTDKPITLSESNPGGFSETMTNKINNSVNKYNIGATDKNKTNTSEVVRKETNKISEIKIDEKLKTLILIAINQKKEYTISYNNQSKKSFKVYLINNNLDQFKFKEINSLINENPSKLKTSIITINNTDIPLTSKQIKEITENLNQEKLKTLNEAVKNISITSNSFKWEPKKQKIKLLNSNEIEYFSEFIICQENIFNELKRNFGIQEKIEPVYYIHTTSGDIIYAKNILFYGKIDKTANIYDIKYIFEFNKENDLTFELNDIKNGAENYIRKNAAFADNNAEDKVSPIFSSFKTIGNVYKFISNNDYSKCVNYMKYLKNEKLSKFIALYNFYNDMQKNLNKSSYIPEKYYLIKESIITQIKNICNYDELKQIFDSKNIKLDIGYSTYSSDDKKMLNIIKNIPENLLIQNFSNNTIIKKIPKKEIEPEKIYIINPKNSECSNIYNNCALINKNVGELFFEGLFASECFDCTLNNGRIMIDYKTSLQNSKYVCVISTLDSTNFMLYNEYALIYEDYYSYNSHSISIKNRINKFIQELQLVNGNQPITDRNYKEIGIIIDIQQSLGIKNPIIPSPTPTPDPIPPRPPSPPKDDPDYYKCNSNITSINQYYPYPTLIGLDNIGATCYMNATLQCFCNISKFVEYFKYNKHLVQTVKQDVNKVKLCSAFKLIVEKLWPDDYNYKKKLHYAPENFKKIISFKNPLFEGVQANDAKDLINFIIMTLHDELNKAKNNNNFNTNNPSFSDQRNQQLMFNNFIQNFGLTNQSKISDLFYAMNCTMNQCSLCGNQTYSYQTYFSITFPLEEVRKSKMSNYNQFSNYNNMFNNNEVNIYDCFDYDKKISFMTGENAMYCNFCKKTANSQMCTVLTTGPEVLIIILNRGKGIEFNVKINFVELLNLANYIQFQNTGVNYELIGVITHMGESGMAGHFIAYCKSPISHLWYQYNDAIVNQVNNFKSEVIDYAMPYVLFYQKMH